MDQKRKFSVLVVSCVIILSGLIAIQFYLIRNTYFLSKDSFRNAVRASFLRLESSPQYTSVFDSYQKILRKYSNRIVSGKFDEYAFKDSLVREARLTTMALDRLLKSASQQDVFLKGVNQRIAFDNISIATNAKTWQIIRNADQPLIISENQSIKGEMIDMGTISGETYQTGVPDPLKIRYNLKRLLFADNHPQSVTNELLWVGGLSLLLLLGVITAFFYVFKSAIFQRQLAEIKTDLVNNIAHELKTPLSSMNLVFKTLHRLEVNPPPSQKGDLIAALERQHHKLELTIERVLDSAIEEKSEAVLPLDITAMLINYRDHHFIEDHPLVFNIPSERYLVAGKPGVIEAALDNLVENAKKYTPPGSTITITAAFTDSSYCIHVIDQGKGIPQTYQRYLFDKFFRVPEQDRHTVKGLGLGLFLSRKALREIDGDVVLTSSTMTGCTFSIYLKLL